jgi:hypothetical protein
MKRTPGRLALSRGAPAIYQIHSGRSPDLACRTQTSVAGAFPTSCQWRFCRWHKLHSGGTVRDFHPLPYSPRERGTRRAFMNEKNVDPSSDAIMRF